MPDGQSLYVDTLTCPANTKQVKPIEAPKRTYTQPAPARSTPQAGPAPPPAITPEVQRQMSKRETVQFSGNASMDLIKSSALLDNIKTLGRDCEWALKVDDSKMQKCRDFLFKLTPGGEYEQISNRVIEIGKDRKVLEENATEARRVLRHMQDIVRYKEFALANLKSR